MYVGDWCYKCRLYDRQFFRKQSLSIHTRLHNNVGVKKCALCNVHFSTESQPIQHGIIQNGKPPYKCGFCEKRFKTLSNAKVLKRRLHCGKEGYPKESKS